MRRIHLQTYKGLLVTPDMAEALHQLEVLASDNGKWRVRFLSPPSVPYSGTSLAPAGREVRLVFEKDGADQLASLHAAWGHAVPLGFTPKLRDPLLEEGYEVFHYFGPWRPLYGKMLAEGRGHLAWPSVCCAAQVDAGAWEGDKEEARFVQAQLHRLGRNCGSLDGVVGPRTAAALESLALPRGSLTSVAEHLKLMDAPLSSGKISRGHLHLPGHKVVVSGHGGVKAWPMSNGAGLEISGPGRLVVDVR